MASYRGVPVGWVVVVVCSCWLYGGCEQAAKTAVKEGAEAADREAKELGRALHPKPELNTPPDLRDKVFLRMKECDIDTPLPEVVKDSADAAAEARKAPLATEESVSRAVRLAALKSADKNSVKLPVSILECIVKSASGALLE